MKSQNVIKGIPAKGQSSCIGQNKGPVVSNELSAFAVFVA
jgi:hypothetical protein